MNIDQLKTFYVVAHAGSFTKAAEDLNMDQSNVSRKIIALEIRLGIKLFKRLARGLILTKQGEILLKEVKDILFRLDSIKTKVKESEHSYKGDLKISSTVALASMWLMPYLNNFLDLHSEMRATVLSNDSVPDLTLREADVAIRPYIHDAPDLVQDYLITFHWQLYASPQYLDQYGTPKTIDDLDGHRLLSFEGNYIQSMPQANWHLMSGKKGRDKRPPYFSSNSLQTLVHAAKCGMGIVPLPYELSSPETANLVQILPEAQGPAVDVYYIYPRALESYKLARAFGQFLQKKIGVDAPESLKATA